jgi:hypothetical protein
MNRNNSFLIGFLVLFGSGTCSYAADFRSTLLAGYEYEEQDRLIVSSDPIEDPNLTVTWPVLGGVNGVPHATQGDYVLKMELANETDVLYPQIQVRHDWNDFTFDLTDNIFIHVDVYVADENAMSDPDGVGIWNNDWPYPFQWLDAGCDPVRINEWRTISICAAGLDEKNLDHIEALVFDKLAGVSGTIYLDNLRLGVASPECNCLRRVRFAGYNWSVLQSDWPMGVGPNFFTDESNDVWVDSHGYLHLNILYKDPNWYCSEVVANENFGYGKYVFTLKAHEELLDPYMVLGLFIFDNNDPCGNPREIDFELSRWWHAEEPNNAQFVVQPWDGPDNRYRYCLDEHRTTTHEIVWMPDRINFHSYYGDYPISDKNNSINYWTYRGDDIPAAGNENPRMNLWLLPPEGSPDGTPGAPPSNSQDAEVILKNFLYLPIPGDLNHDKVINLEDFVLFADNWLIGVE